MDEAHAVMQRLERIEALDRERARPETLIAELRELVREAEEWVRAEGEPERAAAALDKCKESLDGAIVPA
jgi:Asp-tRNA(Asn)/Glu-tRNA(Gln) amidotransferase C subunit